MARISTGIAPQECLVACYEDAMVTLRKMPGELGMVRWFAYEVKVLDHWDADVPLMSDMPDGSGSDHIPECTGALMWKAMPMVDILAKVRVINSCVTKAGDYRKKEDEFSAAIFLEASQHAWSELHEQLCAAWAVRDYDLEGDNYADDVRSNVTGFFFCDSCCKDWPSESVSDYWCDTCSETTCENCGPCSDHYCDVCGSTGESVLGDSRCPDCSSYFTCEGCEVEYDKSDRNSEDEMCPDCSDYDECTHCCEQVEKDTLKDDACATCRSVSCIDCSEMFLPEHMVGDRCVECDSALDEEK